MVLLQRLFAVGRRVALERPNPETYSFILVLTLIISTLSLFSHQMGRKEWGLIVVYW